MVYNPASGGTYNLGSSIGSTDTSILLSSFKDPTTEVAITMATLNTSIAYGTIGPRTSSFELISFTGITQNADGTALLTGVTRGLQRQYPFTSSVSYKLPHSGQSIFILSDAPQVFEEFASLLNNNTFSGDNTFSVHSPTVPTEISSEIHRAASIEYANALSIAGAPDSSTTVKGIGKVSVAPVSPTNPIFVGDNDSRIPTQGQKDGLAATTTPATTNLFITQKDFQKGAEISGSTTGSANAYVFTPSPAIAAYAAGMTFRLKANFTNSGAATLNTSGLGAVAIKKLDGATALASGDIVSGQEFVVVHDGTNFQMVSPVGSTPGGNSLLFQSSSPITQNTTDTSEHNVISQSIAGGTLGTANAIRFRARGTWTNQSGATVTTLRAYYGATAIYTAGLTASADSNVYNFEFDVVVYATGATNSQTGKGFYRSFLVNTSGPTTLTGHSSEATANAVEDSTAAKNFIVSTQLGSSSNASKITITDYTIERLA